MGGKANPVSVAWHREGFIDLGGAVVAFCSKQDRDVARACAGLTSPCCWQRLLLFLNVSWLT